ncbi:SRPBCC domain-containing protein [Pontibacter toksunensis]|uniref:SRPBCC domain-containing protein n=1 Tax=Pontibacter toksunensis TaxID=1332631 RepID=A0ABW6C0U7_9BACT
METTAAITNIKVSTTIQAPVEKVWKYWTEPQHIMQWNNASGEWHTPRAENDLRVGGKFLSRMEARDGSMGFDFSGIYTAIQEHKLIEYALEDGRKVQVLFVPNGRETSVTETFAAEQTHPVEMQRAGWQAILDNFKSYVESSGKPERLHFETSISAKAEKVYRTMLDEKQYAAWTAVFSPTSHYSGTWQKGTKILFLGEDKDGNTEGMVSRIKENIPNQFVSIEHLGLVKNGTEVTSGVEVEGWAGAMENYTFSEDENTTMLSVDIDINQEYKTFFSETWPKALHKLKEICEA